MDEDWFSIQEELESELKSIYKTTKKLNKDPDRQLYDRLQSILDDYQFVNQVKSEHPSEWPVFANLRCGLWYAPKFDNTCYYKSTDGHVGKWAFSISRLNLNVAEAAAKHGGVLIIDSTRKGKRYPDSRTIPIWTCIINRTISILRDNPSDWDKSLHMPPWVPKSEQSQVEKRLDTFVQTLLSSGADLSYLVTNLSKPLQCMWVSPSEVSILDEEQANYSELPFIPIICVSVSKAVTEEQKINTSAGAASFYIQGAGDDEESWANNLTPALFWANKKFIMGSGPSGIVSRVKKSMKNKKDEEEEDFVTEEELIASLPLKIVNIASTKLAIGCYMDGLDLSIFEKYNAVVNTSPSKYDVLESNENYVHLPVLDGKSDKNKLGKILPDALEFIFKQLKQGNSVLIHSYKDLNAPVCICVAALVRFFSPDGELQEQPQSDITKATIRNHFVFVEKFCPQSRPPKVMTNEVNRYFMTPSDLQSKQLRKYLSEKNKENT